MFQFHWKNPETNLNFEASMKLSLISVFILGNFNANGFIGSSGSGNEFGNVIQDFFSDLRNPAKLTTISLINGYGYPAETHHVTTADGYILELHRVPYGLESPPGPGKIPVIIQHGNFQSSADWMINSPANNSLPLILADKGYDVWLGNQRGNTYSNQHVKYRLTSPSFWNYSYHEAALYDVPAVIDYVLAETKSNRVHYISHSVGGKNFIAGMTLRPQYNDKIGIGITMGPAGYMSHMFNGYARRLLPLLRLGEVAFKIVGPIPVIPHTISNFIRTFMPAVCNPRIDTIGICAAFFFSITGVDREQISAEKIAKINSVFPSPTSLKLWLHLVQEIQSGHYAQFDYGTRGNLATYGHPNPPDYNLSLVTAPMSIFHGNYDHIARIEDTESLAKELPNVVDFYVVPWTQWTHMDFNYAKDAGKLCYSHILEMLEQYNFKITFA